MSASRRGAPGPVGHLLDLARGRFSRSQKELDDSSALADMQRRSLDLPDGLELEWLGVSGYRFTYEGHTLFLDPYLSRVPLSSLLLRRLALPDGATLDRLLRAPGQVVGVLVGHTHFDHAVDAPEIARRFGCKAYGSESLAQLMHLHGIGQQSVVVDPYRTYELGPFQVSFTPSAHSKLLLGLAVPMDGEVSCDHLDGMCPSAYRCGQVWGMRIEVAGTSFFHQGSANLIDEALARQSVDVFLAGIAGRNFTPRYWERVLPRLQPRFVVPTHYDDFFAGLEQPMGFVANVNLAEVPAEVQAVSRDFEVLALARLADGPLAAPAAGLSG
jgi:L-ascorbate metabolism protein UlaG (beta-lactamase superfamily)